MTRIAPHRAAAGGSAIQRVLVALCVAWILGVVVWWFLGSDEGEPRGVEPTRSDPDTAPPPDPGDSSQPLLAGRAAETDDPIERRLKVLAAACARGNIGGNPPPKDDWTWLQTWLAEDSEHVVAFVRAMAAEAPTRNVRFSPGRGSQEEFEERRRIARGVGLGFSVERTITWLHGSCAHAIPRLIQCLDSANTELWRTAVVRALGAFGPAAKEAFPKLEAMLQRAAPGGLLAGQIPRALMRIAGASEAIVPTIEALLRRKGESPSDLALDRRMLVLLHQLEQHAVRLTPALIEYLANPRSLLRSQVFQLLSTFDLDAESRRSALLAAWRGETRGWGTLTQVMMRAMAKEDLLALLPALAESTGWTRVQAVESLVAVGLDGKELGYLVLPLLQEEKFAARPRVVKLLPMVVKDVDEVLPIVRSMLAGQEPAHWLTATRALGALTSVPGNREAVTRELVSCIRSKDARVRKIAVQSLLMFDDQAVYIVPMLGDLLRDDDAAIRAEAVDALGELSPDVPAARAHLQSALSDPDENVRKVAKYWLEDEGDDDEDD